MWDIEVKETVWHRLANEIFFRILRGEYTIGKKLPSYIYIAKEAGSSPETGTIALRVLLRLDGREVSRRGFKVTRLVRNSK